MFLLSMEEETWQQLMEDRLHQLEKRGDRQQDLEARARPCGNRLPAAWLITNDLAEQTFQFIFIT